MASQFNENREHNVATIWTEGKTDWRILKRALEAMSVLLPVVFHESDEDVGDVELLRILKTFAKSQQPNPMIFIFDRDNDRTLRDVEDTPDAFKDWGNNVFSFAIPVPNHRTGYSNISIEMYFTDEEIQRRDANGRQLFLTSSFHERSGKLKTDASVHCSRTTFLSGNTAQERAKIVDAEVYDAENRNIALSTYFPLPCNRGFAVDWIGIQFIAEVNVCRCKRTLLNTRLTPLAQDTWSSTFLISWTWYLPSIKICATSLRSGRPTGR